MDNGQLKIDNGQEKHHPYGMSRFPALAQCPWYEGGDRPSEDAAEGSKAHRLLEGLVRCWPSVEGLKDSPHYATVMWARDALNEALPEGLGGIQFVEKRVTLKSPLGCVNGVFGTLDYGGLADGAIVVVDFKTFGNGQRSYFEQLAGYAYGLACELGISDENTNCGLVTLHGAVKKIDVNNVPLGKCIEIVERVLDGVAGRKDGDQCANDYCRYCRHYPCRATRLMAEAVAPSSIPTLLSTREEMLADPSRIPSALVLVSEFERLVKRFKENAEEVIKARGDHSVDGNGMESWTLEDADGSAAWQIKQTSGNRKFEDIQRLWAHCETLGVSQDDFLSCCNVQIGRLAKLASLASGRKLASVERELDSFAVRGDTRETMRRLT